jgi:maltooligosyltrehalose trehalohydrolase
MPPSTQDLGAQVNPDGVLYTIWAPDHADASVSVEPKAGGLARRVDLHRDTSGYFQALDPLGVGGDLYTISLDGAPGIPDPASRFQPEGVFGPSQVVDSRVYPWQPVAWQRPAWNGQVVYELHIGTFTPEGTWRAAIDHLDQVRDLGVTVIEIMPVSEWRGRWNWGYDGVYLFAPSHNYGTPDDMRAFVDACHQRGLAVMLDTVYNHVGPAGDHLSHYAGAYFDHGAESPWGRGYNLDGPDSAPVRHMILQNIRYWLTEFRLDGFRMDATQAIKDDSPRHILSEIREIVHAAGGFIIAEDNRNSAAVLDEAERGGWRFDGVWANDFHHTARVSQTREKHTYFVSYLGSADEIVETLKHGWLFTGQYHPFTQKNKGESCSHFPPQQFVYCISNHDQVGNRAWGERMHDLTSPEGYRALSLFLCLIPYTPMLFMGQEWAASSPFLYFTDQPAEVGDAIRAGRRHEFGFTDTDEMLDPQDPDTFRRSALIWEDLRHPAHAKVLDLYRDGLKLRRELFGSANPPRDTWQVQASGNTVVIDYRINRRHLQVYYYMEPTLMEMPHGGRCLIHSNEVCYSDGPLLRSPETLVYCFS